MADSPIVIEVSCDPQEPTMSAKRKSQKRKRVSPMQERLSEEARESRIKASKVELEGLFKYYRELMADQGSAWRCHVGDCSALNLSQKVALLLEESELPLSQLVQDIKGKIGNVTAAAVKSTVLCVGQRTTYGISDADADILEDQSNSSLWCWETRDLKLIPKAARDILKIRRTCRKKIHERIAAVSAVITELDKLNSHQDSLCGIFKASEKLARVLSEADIRLLAEGMLQTYGKDIATKETKLEDKLLVKQFEKNKREAEKEKKKLERELQKEKLQNEKELRRLQEEAEKDERRREREESEIKKRLKKQQEETERDQRRQQKEEAELKKQLSVKKQASIMERFLKRSKASSCQIDHSLSKAMTSDSQGSKVENIFEAVTLSMDSALSSKEPITINEIRRSHLSSWRQSGLSLRVSRKQHWGTRTKPKTNLYKELKLSASRHSARDDYWNVEKFVDGWGEQNSADKLCVTDADCCPDVKKCNRRWQLLQFDKSHRPAFYGIWPKKSQVVGPRHPLRKDPDLEYDIDSDEEWEEEDPGESLSDCDKDDEESLEEGCSKGDDEDESEDGFFVPDGYLSENEGVQIDRMETDFFVESRSSSGHKQDTETLEFCALIQQRKYLYNLTEHALRKNQPLIILNLRHDKCALIMAEELSGTSNLEKSCLQALSMQVFPGGQLREISVSTSQDEYQDKSTLDRKGCSTPISAVTGIGESDLPTIVSAIQSCPQGIKKLVESLQHKFPSTPKSQLRNKVREISDFVDNRWQVKKDILNKVGWSNLEEKGGERRKSITKFFPKRCLPLEKEAK